MYSYMYSNQSCRVFYLNDVLDRIIQSWDYRSKFMVILWDFFKLIGNWDLCQIVQIFLNLEICYFVWWLEYIVMGLRNNVVDEKCVVFSNDCLCIV